LSKETGPALQDRFWPELVKTFHAPKQSLGMTDAESLARIVAGAADFALALDADGTIVDVAAGNDAAAPAEYAELGRPRVDRHGHPESRPKILALLRDATEQQTGRLRQVNHPSEIGPDVPVAYSATRIRKDGRILALGRNLRPVAELQQRLIEAQQSMEREFSRLRSLETRYRMLFEVASEGVLIIDQLSERVIEANPAAEQLLGEGQRRVVGRPFPDGFDAAGTQALLAMLGAARATGRSERVDAGTADGRQTFSASAFLFRQDGQGLYLVRLVPASGQGGQRLSNEDHRLLSLMQRSPDGNVVTDREGRILACNEAFLDLLQLPSADQVKGQSLSFWFGRTGVELDVLLSSVRQSGVLRFYSSTLRGAFGATAEVEVSGTTLENDGETCIGLSFRNIGLRLPTAGARTETMPPMPRSVEQLSELVGRVSLKELVREATDMIEKLSIEAALQLTDDNRASAAELLGLSRQSLYVKLRRYGLADYEPGATGGSAQEPVEDD
jgi:transcriptional regulator PpsR